MAVVPVPPERIPDFQMWHNPSWTFWQKLPPFHYFQDYEEPLYKGSAPMIFQRQQCCQPHKESHCHSTIEEDEEHEGLFRIFSQHLCHQILNHEVVNPFAGSNPGDDLPIMTILRKGDMHLTRVPALNAKSIGTLTQVTFQRHHLAVMRFNWSIGFFKSNPAWRMTR